METIKISISNGDSAREEVLSTVLAEQLVGIAGCSVQNSGATEGGRRARFTGLEIIATIVTSAAVTQLAKAVRDAVQKNKVDVVLKRSDGTELYVAAKGTTSVEKIVEFAGASVRQKKD